MKSKSSFAVFVVVTIYGALPVQAGSVVGPAGDNPTVIEVQVPDVATTPKAIGASKKGRCFRQTDALQTSAEPALVFRVEKTAKLSIQIEGVSDGGRDDRWACFNLWFPDNTVLSASPKKGALTTDTFPAGEYRLHVAFNKSTPKKYWAKRLRVTIVDPERPATGATAFSVTSRFSNPTVIAFTPQPATVQASALGMTKTGCRGMTSLFPTLTLDVKAETLATIGFGGSKFMVKTPSGGWFCQEHGAPLKTKWSQGAHQVWVFGKAGQKMLATMWDDARAPDYTARNPAKSIDSLNEPQWIDGALQPRPDRVFSSDCYARYGREPDVLLKTSRPIADLKVELVDPSGTLRVDIEGPMNNARPRLKKTCNTQRTMKIADGTYAVFVGHKANDAPPPERFLLLVTDRSSKREPLTLLPSYPVNETLDIAERAFTVWYPFLETKTMRADTDAGVQLLTKLFTTAPRSMFVYPRYDLDDVAVSDTDRKLGLALPKKSEALLVVRAAKSTKTDARHLVLTADGEMMQVLASALSASASGPVYVSKAPRREREVESHYELHEIALEKDKKAIDKFYAMSRRADDCWNKFWKKHHGGTSTQLYTVSYRNGKVVGVTDYSAKIRKKADKKCRVSKVAAYHGRLTKRLNRAFSARRGKALAEVRSRFQREAARSGG